MARFSYPFSPADERKEMEGYKTSDVVISSYLVSKGYSITGHETESGMVFFVFDPEVEEIVAKWQFSPDPEMEAVQKFHTEKEKLFRFLSAEKRKFTYGQQYK